MRLTLKTPSLSRSGEKPNYADYIVFGAFQWARFVSPFNCSPEGDPSMHGGKDCSTRSDGDGRGNRRGHQV